MKKGYRLLTSRYSFLFYTKEIISKRLFTNKLFVLTLHSKSVFKNETT